MENTSNCPVRVLVVDDKDAILLTFQWMLEILGHEVRVASNGNDAISVARSFMPEFLLLDISLPDMDGFELCRRLHAEPGLEQSTFVALTGWSQPEYKERSRQAGFNYHMVKPVKPEQLKKLFEASEPKPEMLQAN